MYEAHDALLAIAEGRLLSEPTAGASRRSIGSSRRPTCAAVRRPAGGLRQHARHRAALRGDDGDAQAAAAGLAKVRAGSTEEETVRAMAIEGLERRMDAVGADAAMRARYRERLDYELVASSSPWGLPAIS